MGKSYFPVPRFGHVTSNIAESINSAIGDDIRKKAPFFILVEITRKITQTIVQRKNENFLATSNFNNSITKKLKAKLQANISIARALKTIPTSDPCIYEVQDHRISSTYRIVDISNKSCTCK